MELVGEDLDASTGAGADLVVPTKRQRAFPLMVELIASAPLASPMGSQAAFGSVRWTECVSHAAVAHLQSNLCNHGRSRTPGLPMPCLPCQALSGYRHHLRASRHTPLEARLPSGEISRARNRLVQRPSPRTEGYRTAITRFCLQHCMHRGVFFFDGGTNLLLLHHRHVVNLLFPTLSFLLPLDFHLFCCRLALTGSEPASNRVESLA
ncbi:hypothetical protein V8C37DRAFT_286013 [Trichoderma ceciliae]